MEEDLAAERSLAAVDNLVAVDSLVAVDRLVAVDSLVVGTVLVVGNHYMVRLGNPLKMIQQQPKQILKQRNTSLFLRSSVYFRKTISFEYQVFSL